MKQTLVLLPLSLSSPVESPGSQWLPVLKALAHTTPHYYPNLIHIVVAMTTTVGQLHDRLQSMLALLADERDRSLSATTAAQLRHQLSQVTPSDFTFFADADFDHPMRRGETRDALNALCSTLLSGGRKRADEVSDDVLADLARGLAIAGIAPSRFVGSLLSPQPDAAKSHRAGPSAYAQCGRDMNTIIES